jgi:hypothetical protein
MCQKEENKNKTKATQISFMQSKLRATVHSTHQVVAQDNDRGTL